MIKIGILGYGNIGRGVALAVWECSDMRLEAVFTRRDPASVVLPDGISGGVSVVSASDMSLWRDKIDVIVLCGGSSTDLMTQGPEAAQYFNTVDSYDTHAKIPGYYAAIDSALRKSRRVGIISAGWDPGLFSLNRLYMEAALPAGKTFTFWGEGVSQGHSTAAGHVSGVSHRPDGTALAVQYTVPSNEIINRIRETKRVNDDGTDYTIRQKHKRVCYIVPEPGADREKIAREIKSMPDYFADYETIVNFISAEEFEMNHTKMPHGGKVIRCGVTNGESNQLMEFSLKLNSNPEFTGSILAAFARAAYRLSKDGEIGCRTPFDIAPFMLSERSPEELRRELL